MQQDPLSLHIKLTFGVCTMIGIAAFVFGAIRMQRNIAIPFVRSSDVVYKNTDQLQKEREQKLKTTDSDGDTLTDYDEMFVFKTSAFLTDTDSDGDPDNVEIASGGDPNCPKGKTCRIERSQSEQAEATTGGSGSTTAGSAPTPPAAQPSVDEIVAAITETYGPISELTTEKIATRTNEMQVEELYTFLSALGIPQEIISQQDTATLRKVVQETLVGLVAEVTNASSPAQGQSDISIPAQDQTK